MISAQKLQYCMVGLMVGGSASALAAILLASSSGVVGSTEPGLNSPARLEVEKLLRSYQRAWHPSDRLQVVEAGKENAQRYGPVLRYILLRPWHQLAEPAIEMAAAWEITPALAELVALATKGPPGLRPAALAAADRLEPWSLDELLEFVRDPVGGVQVAAFDAICRREDAPWREVFGLMVDADPAVRDAAVEALPTELPEAAIDALAQTCERLDGEATAQVLHALAKGLTDERTERAISRLLGSADDRIVGATLDTLATKPSPLLDAQRVWEIADDPIRADDLRTRAMRCLEQTASFDVESVRTASGLPPIARYFAARCLLRAGDLAGAEVLIALIEEEAALGDGARKDSASADTLSAAQAGRRLLSWLSGVRAASTAPEFRDWIRQAGEDFGPRPLPAPPF